MGIVYSYDAWNILAIILPLLGCIYLIYKSLFLLCDYTSYKSIFLGNSPVISLHNPFIFLWRIIVFLYSILKIGLYSGYKIFCKIVRINQSIAWSIFIISLFILDIIDNLVLMIMDVIIFYDLNFGKHIVFTFFISLVLSIFLTLCFFNLYKREFISKFLGVKKASIGKNYSLSILLSIPTFFCLFALFISYSQQKVIEQRNQKIINFTYGEISLLKYDMALQNISDLKSSIQGNKMLLGSYAEETIFKMENDIESLKSGIDYNNRNFILKDHDTKTLPDTLILNFKPYNYARFIVFCIIFFLMTIISFFIYDLEDKEENKRKVYKMPFKTILLIRHCKPLIDYLECSYTEMLKRLEEYNSTSSLDFTEITSFLETSVLKKDIDIFAKNPNTIVFSSSMPHALLTAKTIFENANEINVDSKFVEFNLNIISILPRKLRLKFKTWAVMSRLCWFLGFIKSNRSFSDERIRAKECADILYTNSKSRDFVALVAHGMLNFFTEENLADVGYRRIEKVQNGFFTILKLEKLN